MGQSYGGILGLIAFLVVLGRSFIHGSDIGVTLRHASSALFLFAAIGWFVGQLADWIVYESVRDKLSAEIALSEQVNEQKEKAH